MTGASGARIGETLERTCGTIIEIDVTARRAGSCGPTAAKSGRTGASFTVKGTNCALTAMIAARMFVITGATGVTPAGIKELSRFDIKRTSRRVRPLVLFDYHA